MRGVKGLSTANAFAWIEQTPALTQAAENANNLPKANDFDDWHREICNALAKKARAHCALEFGVAAKLVNVYLKTIYLSEFGKDGENASKIDAIHPPIDNLLLAGVKASTGGVDWRATFAPNGWKAISSSNYYKLISQIRLETGGELWKIEEYWPGYS